VQVSSLLILQQFQQEKCNCRVFDGIYTYLASMHSVLQQAGDSMCH
jgi:hypothetical protein